MFIEPLIKKIFAKAVEKKMSNFLEEDNGNKSSMRLMSFIALLAAVIIALIGVWFDKQLAITFVEAFLAAAFIPKTVQKFAESKPAIGGG